MNRRKSYLSISGIALLFVILIPLHAGSPPDAWAALRFMAGEWQGTAQGMSGYGEARRSYTFILHDRYLHEQNTTIYPAQEKNKQGEIHEHWSFFSYDRQRKLLALRQFHVEGFVNLYTLNLSLSDSTKLVFDSEHFENFSNDWKARETYQIISNDEFVETFELVAPGKSFEIYSKTRLKRIAK